jgi:Arc/MetJ-type ribon-helix-helix transcriptional regulator
MREATITLPDELDSKLEEYLARTEPRPSLSEVVQTALSRFLEDARVSATRSPRRPVRITPAERGSGHSDISRNHDRHFAEIVARDR